MWGRSLLIMDEPTAALGVHQTEMVQQLIKRVRDEKQLSIILISHSLPEIFAVADRVTVLRLGRTVLSEAIGDVTIERLVGAMAGIEPQEEAS